MNREHLPENWQFPKVGDLCKRVKIITPNEHSFSSFQYIDISSIDKDSKAITSVQDIVYTNAPSRARQVVAKGDVLVSTVRPALNSVALIPQDLDGAICSTGFCVLRPQNELLDAEFLFAWVCSSTFIQHLTRFERGIGYPAVSEDDVKSLPIPLPPLSEQKRIVAILRQANELRRLRKNAIEEIRKLYKVLFYDHFGLGYPTPKHPHTLKLEKLLKEPLTSGFSPSETTDTPPGTAVFTLNALTDVGLDDNQVKYYTHENYRGRGYNLEVGDILISRSNTHELVGRVGTYQGKPSPIIYPDLMIRIRLKNTNYSLYVENFLRSDAILSTIRRMARGTSGSMKKISQGDINEFDILWPSEKARQEFIDQLKLVDQQRESLLVSSAQLDSLYQSLLAQAFTGELTTTWRGREILESFQQFVRETIEKHTPVDLTPNPPVLLQRPGTHPDLSEEQKALLSELASADTQGYFTAETLKARSKLPLNTIRQGLQLFAEIGLIKVVRLPDRPMQDVVVYVLSYRGLREEDQAKALDLDTLLKEAAS